MNSSLLTAGALLPPLAGLAAAPRWWVALSGGLDSTVLLHLLVAARGIDPGLPPLAALHINHQLQDAADDWQQHCRQLCRELGVPLHCETVAVEPGGKGLEAAARDARHAAFERALGAGEVLFTAHHRDDQVETFFLRLLRGAGVDGLGAMAATRPLGAGSLYRPLLEWPRDALEDYARRHGLRHVEDPSNADTDLDRNFLRSQVLPLLAGRWPGYRDTVSRAAAHLREASAQLRALTPEVPARRNAMGDRGLDLATLLALPPALAGRVLRDWLAELGAAMAPDQAALMEFLRQLAQAGEGGCPRFDAGGLSLQRYRDGVYVLPEFADRAPPAGLVLVPGETLAVAGAGALGLVPSSGVGLDLGPGEALSVRWRAGGERCRPLGRTGSRGLKKLLQEAGVPPWWRDRVPLLYLGGELLAVGDLWLCESSRLVRGGGAWQVRWQRNTPGSRD
ncbi:tRNA lysidine(34) synthetase TilS [Parahaliea mediterranea]|uniref:tRNA(Ile)-lysidine synthase n=1 Tax=Parahaliea mediterranea TaxID=651086 RepID=A0A939DEP9_9GAMM|nr:tRNA lysidine(34) synthetase TilS [Parahaliea mediterranea]MBN7796768.1 tRNA lysidine(34) synthetase TilS [Parahaliea mediterranea]